MSPDIRRLFVIMTRLLDQTSIIAGATAHYLKEVSPILSPDLAIAAVFSVGVSDIWLVLSPHGGKA